MERGQHRARVLSLAVGIRTLLVFFANGTYEILRNNRCWEGPLDETFLLV
jgi:hypothetical protein